LTIGRTLNEEPIERGSFEIVGGFKGHHDERVISSVILGFCGHCEGCVVKKNVALRFENYSIG
jgi:hypothetical protein